MPASIRSTLLTAPGGPSTGPVLTDQSREDLRKGYQVVLESVFDATTYSWSLAFAPDSPNRTSSTAALLAPEGSTSKTARFNVDHEGAYLVRLVLDAGLPTEDVQFIRCRYRTRFGGLKLVAAGERRDENGVVPVDATPEGWSNDQNENMQRLAALIRRQAVSGRILYVDSNRGRDIAEDQNDPDNEIVLPGWDSSTDDDEITLTAESHGDFSSINSAISFAMDYEARGEPEPSVDDPYYIVVRPGLYIEDLNLQPFVYIVSDESETQFVDQPGLQFGISPVVVRTTGTAGLMHRFQPSGDSDICLLRGITLENTANIDVPVLRHTRGLMFLANCTVYQRSNGANAGSAYEAVSATGAILSARYTNFVSLATANDTKFVVKVESPDMTFDVEHCLISGRSGLSMHAEGDYVSDNQGSVDLKYTRVNTYGGYGVRGYGRLNLIYSTLEDMTGEDEKLVYFDAFGAPAGSIDNSDNIEMILQGTEIAGVVTFDTDPAQNDTRLRLDNVLFSGSADPPRIVFPSDTPTELYSGTHGWSIKYDSAFFDPRTSSSPVPVNSRLGVNNVQDAIDKLVKLVLPLGSSPFFSLDSAYDGVSTVNPLVLGDGLGRTINADAGAVKIIGAGAPGHPSVTGTLIDPDLLGGLQTEGVVDIGPLVDDGEGAEIHLNPNPYGAGPLIGLGRQVWPDDVTTTHRGFPAAVIQANHHTNGPFNLRLQTRSKRTSGTDELGRVIISGGLVPSGADPDMRAGSIYLFAGSNEHNQATNVAGDIWLSPGKRTSAGDHGRIYVVRPEAATQAVLQAADPFVGGVDGSIFFGLPGIFIEVGVQAAWDITAVINNFNDASNGFYVASNNGGRIRITLTERGPNADMVLIGDNVAGALNTALGDFQLSGGATFTPGDYPEKVAIYCSDDGELTVDGTLISAGGTSGVSTYVHVAGGGGAENVPSLGGDYIVGVDTGTGTKTVNLPASTTEGRRISIKDEGNNAAVNNITVQPLGGVLVDGAASYVMSVNRESITVYFGNGAYHII